jgi:hypothetical protein
LTQTDYCKKREIPEMKRPTAKKAAKSRPWTKDDVQMLKTLVREKTKTTAVARRLKRTVRATQQKAIALGVKLAGAPQRKRAGRALAEARKRVIAATQ